MQRVIESIAAYVLALISLPILIGRKRMLFSDLAISIWLCGAGVLLLRLLVCQAGLCLLKSKSRQVADADLLDQLESLSRQLQLTRKVKLLLSDRHVIPMTWGVRRCHILLPLEARAWSGDRQRAVLLHELAHVRRHDCLTQWLVQFACALHWFNPLVWVAAWRIEVERERACDDFVLSCGVRAPDYAEHVLNIGSTLKETCTANTAAVAMAQPRGLEGRVRTILDATLNRAVPRRSLLILCLLGFVAALLPIAMMQEVQGGAIEGATNDFTLRSRSPDGKDSSPADAAAELRRTELQQTVGTKPSVATPAADDAQQLLKARDEARLKAMAVERELREAGAGARPDSLGFDSARAERDRELAAARSSGERFAAYDRFAKTTKRLERKIKDEVYRGVLPVGVEEIARFERLQAEIDLARAEGRLPLPTEPRKPAADQDDINQSERAIAESHEEKLRAFLSERRKLKVGKSTLFIIQQLAMDVRDVELQMCTTATQRTATLARYAALMRGLADEAVSALDRVMIRKCSEDAEAELLRAKGENK